MREVFAHGLGSGSIRCGCLGCHAARDRAFRKAPFPHWVGPYVQQAITSNA